MLFLCYDCWGFIKGLIMRLRLGLLEGLGLVLLLLLHCVKMSDVERENYRNQLIDLSESIIITKLINDNDYYIINRYKVRYTHINNGTVIQPKITKITNNK